MLIFLKLGGSLITDKTRPYTPRLDKITSLAGEIASAIQADPGLRIILGHGSGSFGHQAARQFDTRSGVSGKQGWYGFSEVWYQASRLNRLVIDALRQAGLPAVTISPFSSVTVLDGSVQDWNLSHLKTALENGLLPVIHGDVFFDDIRGGTILSTEELFAHLAREMHPDRILLAGLEPGVWQDFPSRKKLLTDLTPTTFIDQPPSLDATVTIDVTGSMRSKLTRMLSLVDAFPGLEVVVFSGDQPGNVHRLLSGETLGTRLHR